MTNLYEEATSAAVTERGLTGTAWKGVVATAAEDMGDRIQVTIPSLNPGRRYGPCRWQSRDDMSKPARGDTCLVLFDDTLEPWVVAWWPFGT